MNFYRSVLIKAAAVALAALGTAGVAQARDNVYWSVGVQAAPGVAVGVSNVQPVYVAPAPVYVQPAPVYVQPRPVYVQPAPVYYSQPAPVVYVAPQWGPRGHWKHRHWRHEHRDWDRD